MNYVTTLVEISAGVLRSCSFFKFAKSPAGREESCVLQTPTTRYDPVINCSGGSASVCSKQLLLYL